MQPDPDGRVSIFCILEPTLRVVFPQMIMRHLRKDKTRSKNYSAIPVDELISQYRVTKAYKYHLKYQHNAPLWEFHSSVEGSFV